MIPSWTDLPQALKVSRELVKSGCKKRCTWRCKCLTSNLKRTNLCQRFGQCAKVNHVDLLRILHWFWKNLLVDITKAFLGPPQNIKLSDTWKMIKYRFSKEILYKYGKIWIQFCPYAGNTGYRKPIFGHIPNTGVLSDTS